MTNPRYSVRFDDGDHNHDLGCTNDKAEAIQWLKEKVKEFTNRTGDFADVDEPGSDEANDCFFEVVLVDEDDAFLEDLNIGWTEEQGYDDGLKKFMEAASMTKTTPYAQASGMDEGAFYNGLPVKWDEEHHFTYFVPKDLAEAKYREQIEWGVLLEYDHESFMEEVEEWGPDGFYNEPETHQMYLDQIPWRRQHYEFNFSWGWCLDKESGRSSIPIDSDAIARWAGIDPADLIHEAP